MLQTLHYTEETQALQEFTSRFAAYDTLDRQIFIAVENTNLKAQRLVWPGSGIGRRMP